MSNQLEVRNQNTQSTWVRKTESDGKYSSDTASFFLFFLLTRFWIRSTVIIFPSTKNLIRLYCLQRTSRWLKGGFYGKITVKQTCGDVKTSINQSCERETWPLTRLMRHLTTQTEQCNFTKRWHSWEKWSKNSGLLSKTVVQNRLHQSLTITEIWGSAFTVWRYNPCLKA